MPLLDLIVDELDQVSILCDHCEDHDEPDPALHGPATRPDRTGAPPNESQVDAPDVESRLYQPLSGNPDQSVQTAPSPGSEVGS